MKKYFIDFIIGLVIGLVFLIGPGIITGLGGLVGFDTLIKFFPQLRNNTKWAESILLFIYLVLGIIPFGIYVTTSFYKKLHPSSKRVLFFSLLSFFLGIFVAYLANVVVIVIAFSRGSLVW